MLRARTLGLSTALLALATASPLAAQTTSSDSSKAPRSQQPAQVTLPPLNFSGVIFGSYSFQEQTTPNQFANQNNNGFNLDRAYLTFRMPAGDRMSIRVTTDLYQTNEAAPSGAATVFSNNAYTVRLKYAYAQYDVPRFANGSQLLARVGILHNVLIDHEESFWPRYLSTVPTERAGYFSSADLGLAGLYTMPNKLGEVYATIVNGPGYASRENNRFKDYALRLSLTPLANQSNSLLQTFTITGWGYKGANASTYVNGATGVTPVGAALDRTRYGALVGIHDPRLALVGEYARRHDEGELGTVPAPVTPRVVTATTGNLWSAYTVVRPFAFINGTGKSPFGLVGRYDHVSPTASTDNIAGPPSTSNSYHNIIAGLFYDLNQKAQLALDYQEALAANNDLSAAPSPGPQMKGYFAHFVVNF